MARGGGATASDEERLSRCVSTKERIGQRTIAIKAIRRKARYIQVVQMVWKEVFSKCSITFRTHSEQNFEDICKFFDLEVG